MSSFLIFIVGLIAQGCFAARILVQLIKSEKQKRVPDFDSPPPLKI